MKKVLALILALIMISTLASCAAYAPEEAPRQQETVTAAPETEEPAAENGEAPVPATGDEPAPADEKLSDVLVVVFSATGTTKAVAEKIAAIEGADLYEIKAAEEYTDADLNWSDHDSRSTKEQNDRSARPEIGSEEISLDGYVKIYVGYPIWWGEEPRILDTFVESHDFEGKTLIPFCTSSSSGIGRSGKNLAENAGSGSWLEGRRFSGSVSEDELRAWIETLK